MLCCGHSPLLAVVNLFWFILMLCSISSSGLLSLILFMYFTKGVVARFMSVGRGWLSLCL